MDKQKIKSLIDAEIERAMQGAHVVNPKVLSSYLHSRTEAEVDHINDKIVFTARTDKGVCLPLDEFMEALRADPDFAPCFELTLRPRPVEKPYEIRHGRDEQRPGDLEALASGKAVLTGWESATKEITELEPDEIAASDSAAINRNVEKIADGSVRVRLDV